MTVQSSIIEHLISLIDDQDLATRIRDRYYHDVEAQANYVQRRVGELEIHIGEQLQQSLGSTNEMISEVLAIGRRQEGAVAELRQEFQSLAETVDDHEREIESFRQSRDQSIAERRQLAADLVESKSDRATIHRELQDAKAERQHMAETLVRIEELLNGRPSNEEAKRLVALIHDTAARVDRLEQAERLSNEQ